jgi:hypothetical protein
VKDDLKKFESAGWQGKLYCEAQPDLIVAAVWAEAQRHYQNRERQMEFVNGYISERRRMDENRSEETDQRPER